MNTSGWAWYIIGVIAALAWKCRRYCYESKGKGISMGKATREWFELETIGSKVSWITTIAIVLVVGTAAVDKIGAAWLFGGILLGMPVTPPFMFMTGSMAEMIAPSVAKWLYSKMVPSDSSQVEQGGE